METASRRRLLLAALSVAVTVLITLVVLAARSSSLQAGDGPTNAGPVIAIVHVIEIVGIALELFAILEDCCRWQDRGLGQSGERPTHRHA